MDAIVSSQCRGGCGTAVHYTLKVTKLDAPKLLAPASRIAYGDGHLCHECHKVVERALGVRRLEVAQGEARKRRELLPAVGGDS